jgi:hypothetical protein
VAPGALNGAKRSEGVLDSVTGHRPTAEGGGWRHEAVVGWREGSAEAARWAGRQHQPGQGATSRRYWTTILGFDRSSMAGAGWGKAPYSAGAKAKRKGCEAVEGGTKIDGYQQVRPHTRQ